MKIRREPEIYKIQPWKLKLQKQLSQGVKMKMLHPSKSRRCYSIPEAELEEAVASFGTDESFVTEATACNCDENCACGGNCGRDCNCPQVASPMNEAHDDVGAKVRMMIPNTYPLRVNET